MRSSKSLSTFIVLLFCLHNRMAMAQRNDLQVLVRSFSSSRGQVKSDSRERRSVSDRTKVRSDATVGSLEFNKAEVFANRQPGSVRISAGAKGFAELRPPAVVDITLADSDGVFAARARVVAPTALGPIDFPIRLRLNGTLQVKFPLSPPNPATAFGSVLARMRSRVFIDGKPANSGIGVATLEAVSGAIPGAGLQISSTDPDFRAAFGPVIPTSEVINGITMIVLTVTVNGTVTIPLSVNVNQRGVDAFGNPVFTSGSVLLLFQAGVEVDYHNYQSGATADFTKTGEIDAAPSAPAGSSLIVDDASTTFFPQLASGGNFAESTLLATNPADTVAEVRLRSFQSDGTPLALTYTSGQSGSDFTFTIPPRSTVALTTVRSQPAQATAGWMRLDSNVQITAVLDFAFFSPGLVSVVGVLNSPARNEFHLPIDTRGNAKAGIAFANPLAAPVRLTLALYDKSGIKVAERTVDLGPGKQLARFVSESPLFDGVPGIDAFLGVLSVKVDGDNEIPAVALRQENILLSAVPVTEGPVAP